MKQTQEKWWAHEALDIYLRDIGKIPLLTKSEVRALAREARAGNKKARLDMIKANLRLVVKIAKDYANLGLPLADLINEGNIGLMLAVDKFDPTKGSLSTYASWWIKRGIRKALGNQSRTIRMPIAAQRKLRKIAKAANNFQEALGRVASDEELAEHLGMKSHYVRVLINCVERPISLQDAVGDRENSTLADMIYDDGQPTPRDQFRIGVEHKIVRELLMSLKPRDSQILRWRFGFEGIKTLTLEEIGALLHVTRERVRQIEYDALKTLAEKIGRLEKADSYILWEYSIQVSRKRL